MRQWYLKTTSVILAVATSAVLLGPVPTLADGAASTRNIILGGAAATLLILNHNKKVHQRYAEDEQRQAALQSQRNDAEAAYASERSAYEHQVAVNQTLEKEVAYQHQVVVKLQRELAARKRTTAQSNGTNQSNHGSAPVVSYGWGRL